jgi:hypothetical protein
VVAPYDTVDFDLPVVTDEMLLVRRHDLDLVTLVSELVRPCHFTIWVEVEIWRVFRSHNLISFGNWILVLSHGTISALPIETDRSRPCARGTVKNESADRRILFFSDTR